MPASLVIFSSLSAWSADICKFVVAAAAGVCVFGETRWDVTKRCGVLVVGGTVLDSREVIFFFVRPPPYETLLHTF